MAKRKKKVLSPEEKLRNFDKWKKSKEYILLKNIKEKYNDLFELLEITPDLIGKWQDLLNDVSKIGKTFKIKGKKFKLKNINQDQIRSAFFAGVNKRDEPFTIENLELDFENKEVPKNSRHLKNNLIELLKHINKIQNLDESNYLDFKKNKIIYKYKEFAKFLKDNIKKKGYLESKKLLDKVLNPLKELMEANFRLNVFEINFKSEKEINENYFQYIALIKNFCEKYQPCQELIYEFSNGKLKFNPDIYSILKKLNYNNWEKKNAEFYYIFPLLECFNILKANLLKLYSLGKNHWKQPTSENVKFLDDIVSFTNVNYTAEKLFGNCLNQVQTNFFYEVCLIIYNSPAKKDLIEKNKKICEKTIPQLIILKSMLHFNEIFEKKLNDKNSLEEKDLSHIFQKKNKKLNFELLSIKEPKKIIKPTDLIPKGFIYKEKIRSLEKTEQIKFDDNNIEDLKKYGRLFLWPDLLPKKLHKEFSLKSREIKNINISLINDLQDYIIIKGMKANGEDYITDRESAIKRMNLLNKKIKEEIDMNLPEKRPPNLWNSPESLVNDTERELRFGVDIFGEEKRDEDLVRLYYDIEKYAEVVKNYFPEKWNFVLDSVIRIFVDFEE